MPTEDPSYIVNRLLAIKADINSRLEGLMKVKISQSRLSFEDIDERIEECLRAIAGLEDTIRKNRDMQGLTGIKRKK